MDRKLVFVLLALSLPVTAAQAASQSPLYVGVLEIAGASAQVPHVRVAFYKDGDRWMAMNTNVHTVAELERVNKTYPPQLDWSVVFDGKKIGNIASRLPERIGFYSDIGVETITTGRDRIPLVRTGAGDFYYQPGIPQKFRPLLLVSADNFRDPDGWKPAMLSAPEKAAGIKAFRKLVPASERCDRPEGNMTKVAYPDSRVTVLKAYRSKNGDVLFGLYLHDPKANCGFFDDEIFYDYWFVAKPGSGPRNLGNQMQPMEAADLDNSGKSQWLFHTSRGDNWGGYAIYWNNFSKHAEFSWNYH